MSTDVQGTAHLRATLVARLATHRARLARLDDHRHNRDGLPSADSGERAIERENEEVVEALEPMTRHEIEAIEAALARREAGLAFICRDCGEPIEPRRVALLPATALCSACAR